MSRAQGRHYGCASLFPVSFGASGDGWLISPTRNTVALAVVEHRALLARKRRRLRWFVTLVAVRGLAEPHFLVEIEGMAALD